MRLSNFLNEHEVNDVILSCSDALNAYKKAKTLLYRGEHGLKQLVNLVTVDKNRGPKDSSLELHNWINSGFKAVFGEQVRSISLFAVQDVNSAKTYGPVYVAVPVGPYHFYYSNEIPDLVENKWIEKLIYSGKFFSDEEVAALAIKYWNDYDTYNTDHKLRETLKEFLGITRMSDDNVMEYLIRTYSDAAKVFVKEFYKKGTNLAELSKVKKSSEVMLVCDKCYLIQKNFFEKNF